jgi:hypothetical protein
MPVVAGQRKKNIEFATLLGPRVGKTKLEKQTHFPGSTYSYCSLFWPLLTWQLLNSVLKIWCFGGQKRSRALPVFPSTKTSSKTEGFLGAAHAL